MRSKKFYFFKTEINIFGLILLLNIRQQLLGKNDWTLHNHSERKPLSRLLVCHYIIVLMNDI